MGGFQLNADVEAKRLAALYRYNVLDTAEDAAFDRITEIAARLFQAPVAVVSFVDRDRQWFKSHFGLNIAETPRAASFCAHAILSDDVMVVPTQPRMSGSAGPRWPWEASASGFMQALH